MFADGQRIGAEQIITNNRLTTLAIDFEKGVNQIEIAGTRIVPEFGQTKRVVAFAQHNWGPRYHYEI